MKKDNLFRTSNIRTMRFLYNLGFDKKSEYDGEKEIWVFERNNELNESLDFFFYMRRTGVENAEIQYRNSEEDVP